MLPNIITVLLPLIQLIMKPSAVQLRLLRLKEYL